MCHSRFKPGDVLFFDFIVLAEASVVLFLCPLAQTHSQDAEQTSCVHFLSVFFFLVVVVSSFVDSNKFDKILKKKR